MSSAWSSALNRRKNVFWFDNFYDRCLQPLIHSVSTINPLAYIPDPIGLERMVVFGGYLITSMGQQSVQSHEPLTDRFKRSRVRELQVISRETVMRTTSATARGT